MSAIGALAVMVVGAFVFSSVAGVLSPGENVAHPIEQEVRQAAASAGSLLPLLLIIALVAICALFITSSQMAFGD